MAQNVVALVLSFGFFALQTSTRPYKLDQDNAFRAATEIHVFFVIVAGLALRGDLTDEKVTEDWYDWALFISFLVLVPGAFFATVASKVYAAGKTLSDDSMKGSFNRLRSGLASDGDRDSVLGHVEAIRLSLGPLQEAGISLDKDRRIEGAHTWAVIGTRLCMGEYKATASAEPITCAVKVRPLSVEGLQAEAAVMTTCQHVNICRMFRAAESEGFHYLAMQLCETTVQNATQNGSLQFVLGQATAVDVCRGLCEGVRALHEASFVHGNIAPANVLLVAGIPKLSGFSSAAHVSQPKSRLSTARVAIQYRAPELASTDGSRSIDLAHPKAADIYALGGTLYFLLSRGDNAGTRESVQRSEVLAHEARSLIGLMMDWNAEDRSSIHQVLEHPMFWSLGETVRYLGEGVGNILPVKGHRSKHPFIANLEAIADRELGVYDEADPSNGGSWARLLDPRYPLPGEKNDGWGKTQRSPAEEEHNYAIYGGPPSKKQVKERDGLVAAGKPLGGHEAKDIRTVGLLKFIRNLDAHAGQQVNAGRFESEDAMRHYLVDPFPWLLMAVFTTDAECGLTDVPPRAKPISLTTDAQEPGDGNSMFPLTSSQDPFDAVASEKEVEGADLALMAHQAEEDV